MSIRPPRNDRPQPPASGPTRLPLRHTGPISRYKVLLHRTADKELMFVVRAVMELTRFGSAEAEFRMWEAYHRGRSVLLTTYLERAELYVQQFTSKGLTVTAEPA